MFEWKSWLGVGAAVAIALVVALVVIVITAVVTRAASRRRQGAQMLLAKVRHPYRLLVLDIAAWIAVAFTLPNENWGTISSAEWHGAVHHAFLIVTIAISTWLIAALLGYGLGLAVVRY
jgi:hypothetical protein